jgi:DNA-binding NtrC family response regulator
MGNGQFALIVDDDVSIRTVLRALVTMAGYHAVECGDAEEALALIDQNAGATAILIADYSLPGMNGLALLRETARVAPWINVVLISGHRHLSQECRREHGVKFLAKPFGTADVLRTLANFETPKPFRPKSIRPASRAVAVAL